MKYRNGFDISKQQVIEVLKFAGRSVAAPPVDESRRLSMRILFDHV